MNTNSFVVWVILQNNADWVGLFQDSDFAGDLEDSKSISGPIRLDVQETNFSFTQFNRI